MGMGRGAGLEETYIDNMKEAIRALVCEVLLEKKEETASFLLEERQPYELLGKKNGQRGLIMKLTMQQLNEMVRRAVQEVLQEKKEEKKWMQKAGKEMEKKGTKGALHKQLGKPEGEKLSRRELESLKRELQAKAEGDKKLSPSDRKLLRRVIFALNATKAKD
jgi:hypothetical protein